MLKVKGTPEKVIIEDCGNIIEGTKVRVKKGNFMISFERCYSCLNYPEIEFKIIDIYISEDDKIPVALIEIEPDGKRFRIPFFFEFRFFNTYIDIKEV
ncbi:MAG: hypothetical protein JHC31_05515 [Sulfurihydrogenibium sp.]|nr:hypothetical protein [Sulfurihydrogenibium sp.]